ncbi:unnamed protein product [Heligmosomoides polygyrus]|uniref:CCDC50_N domain-containing protein n=1 Tax=Heligmosomoides polygyrus TaxID=6339 RepID=A0A183GJT6_HELPZ|nr:unnamed protein product [Heligmosomoides polygyrus]
MNRRFGTAPLLLLCKKVVPEQTITNIMNTALHPVVQAKLKQELRLCSTPPPEQKSRAGANQYEHYEHSFAPCRAKGERRATNAERKRRSREQMSGEEIEARRVPDAEGKRRSREQMNDSEMEVLRAANAERQRRYREQMDDTEIEALRAANAERQRPYREQMNDTEIGALRAANAERQRRSREQMNEIEIEARRKY